MADAKQCDRCKDFYAPYNMRYSIIDYEAGKTMHGDYTTRKLDLCPCCNAKLIKFVKMEDFKE